MKEQKSQWKTGNTNNNTRETHTNNNFEQADIQHTNTILNEANREPYEHDP
ncbi:protein of unknown function [Vibrio tapetis subsp. tapetis]|uniref:Uncharacterized protein n=1 Tax=Vibrio tapetis subsp. tapetis TaxID=1671868 RepID=A0A2N8ZJY2_9VIBR|nr:protein of unknown function [Vibrio tapetis subsp. tapetis]